MWARCGSLQLSASYVRFDFDDRIVRLEAVARIPDTPGTGDCGILGPNRLYEEFFREDPDGVPCFDGVDANGDGKLQREELTHAFQSYTNIATSELEGVDLRLTAALDTPAGLMNLQLGGTQTLKFLSSERDPLAPPVDAVGRTGVLAFTAAALPRIPDGRQDVHALGRRQPLYEPLGTLQERNPRFVRRTAHRIVRPRGICAIAGTSMT